MLRVLQGYRRCILTPNISELGRLAGAVGVATEGRMGSQWQAHARDIAAGGWTCVGCLVQHKFCWTALTIASGCPVFLLSVQVQAVVDVCAPCWLQTTRSDALTPDPLPPAAAFGGPILVSKGPVDVVTDGSTSLMCSLPATPKRSGGQGDVLTGE